MTPLATFLIAHNKLADQSTFILCTKKPYFIAKVIEFKNKEDLETYTKSSLNKFEILENRFKIIELHTVFSEEKNKNTVDRLLKKMAEWYVFHGEKKA